MTLKISESRRFIPPAIPLPRYMITDFIDQGLSPVYAAFDRVLNRTVAVKQCPAKDLRNVAHEIAFLKHFERKGIPHRLPFIDVYQDGDSINIVTEYLPTCQLHSFIYNEVLTFQDIKSIARQALEFLATVRKWGIIHGDLKPENLIFHNKTLFVIDYGHMGLVEKYKHNTTHPFASPEEILEGKRTPSGDLWSLACVLFILAVKEFLFYPYKPGNEYNKALHLNGIDQQIGAPCKKFLEGCRLGEEFYNLEPEVALKKLDIVDDDPWEIQVVSALKEQKIPDSEIMAFLDLLKSMLVYENRPTPAQLLKSALFQDDVRIHPHMGPIEEDQCFMIFRACDLHTPLPKPVLVIDSNVKECIHLPKDPNDTYIIAAMLGQVCFQLNQVTLTDDSTLHLRAPLFPPSPLADDPVFSPNIPPSEMLK